MNPTIQELIENLFFADKHPTSAEAVGMADRDIAAYVAQAGKYTHTNPFTGTVRRLIPSGAPPGYKVEHVSGNAEAHAAARTASQSGEPQSPKDHGGRYSDRPTRPDPDPADRGTFSDAPTSRGGRRLI
jgi:hypothetical protein